MTRPMAWMAAVRDHPERPPAMQCHVLNYLALRMDWSTGAGFASAGQLAADADCEERTVRRATAWGRKTGMLVQTRRGHRITTDRVIASEWRLVLPETQQDTGVRLGESQPDRDPEPTGQRPRPNRTPAHHHQELGLQDLVPSARGNGANAPRPPRGSTTGDRVRQAIEAGKRVQAMFDARSQPDSARRIWPCPGCHEGFTPEDLGSEENRRSAEEGELWHAECQKAFMADPGNSGMYDSEEERRAAYRAMWGEELP